MNKVWLVTGSASGLGRNIAEAVLESGDRLVATARDTKRLDDLVKKYGDRVRAVPLDVISAQRHRGLTADGLAIRADGVRKCPVSGKSDPGRDRQIMGRNTTVQLVQLATRTVLVKRTADRNIGRRQ